MPNLNFSIAKRYLFGKKSTNLINIITGISVFGIAVGTAALILILSVFNGLEGILTGLFNPYNPDLKVSPIEGKMFYVTDDQLLEISAIDGVVAASKTIEEVCLFEYRGSQEIGIIKGVDSKYVEVTRLDTSITYGKYRIEDNGIYYGVVEEGIRNKLALNIDNSLTPIMAFMPRRKKKLPGAQEFISKSFYPSGVFSKIHEVSEQNVITSLDIARQLLQEENDISTLDIKIADNARDSKVKKELSRILGSSVIVKNKYEQDAQTLKMIAIEKWIAFLITGLTLFLIAFNLVGALWMIVLDKKKDITIFRSFGYSRQSIRNLIMTLGILITLIGIVLGFVIGLSLYFIQKEFGMIGMPAGLMIEAYPVQLKITDFPVVIISVFLIGLMASILPSFKASSLPIELKS